MSAGWVAASVRGRAMLRGVLGAAGAREIATQASWPEAAALLAGSVYGARLTPDADRAAARRTAVQAALWQLRVLAGWLPPGGAGLVRLGAGPVEIANIEGRLSQITGGGGPTAIPLGSLGAAWPRAGDAASPEELRELLARSVWGDPGGSDRAMLALGLRVAWARRLTRAAPLAAPWAAGAVAVAVARELLTFGRPVADVTGRHVDLMLGRGWRDPTGVAEMARRLPGRARWALADMDSPEDLWRAEVAVLRRVRADAQPVATSGRYRQASVAAVLALLLVDLWLTLAAIEAAGRGEAGLEVFDALAS